MGQAFQELYSSKQEFLLTNSDKGKRSHMFDQLKSKKKEKEFYSLLDKAQVSELNGEFESVFFYTRARKSLMDICEIGDFENVKKIAFKLVEDTTGGYELPIAVDALLAIMDEDSIGVLESIFDKLVSCNDLSQRNIIGAIMSCDENRIIEAAQKHFGDEYERLPINLVDEINVVEDGEIMVPFALLDAYIDKSLSIYYSDFEKIEEASPEYFTVDKALKYINDERDEVRGFFYKVLARTNDLEYVKIFIRGMNDKDWKTASESYKFLAKNLESVPDEIVEICKEIGKYRKNTQRAIVQFLKNFKKPDATDLILELYQMKGKFKVNDHISLTSAIKAHKKVEGASEKVLTMVCNDSYDESTSLYTMEYLWDLVESMKPKDPLKQVQSFIEKYPSELGDSARKYLGKLT